MAETINGSTRVLVVEDDDDDYELARYMLARIDGARFETERASNREAALAAIASQRYNVCLVDYRLGADNGIDLVRELSRDGSGLPVIVLTGQDDRAVDVEATDAGAADYLVKSEITPTLLERTIRYAIHTHEHLLALKASEEERLHSQRLEAVGQLAGGIAHDFNNVLTAVIGFAELALLELEGDEGDCTTRSYIEEVKHAGEHAAALTRQLLAFSRKQMLQARALDVNNLVTGLEQMLRRLISDDVELIVSLEDELWPIEADPGQIEQAIMNLAINANDAMPNGGRLTIETANILVDDEMAARHVDVKPGPCVLIAVSDSGIGMDGATLQRIFEPFYTTKGVGKGTGLGLSTVFGIAKQSGGDISVYSEPGIGTTFKIYLPRTLAAVALTTDAAPADELPIGTETILLVDDEQYVRAFEREALTERGYTVIEAKDALDALRLARQHPHPIHLLLTDVVMPNISGRELAEQIAAIRPETRTLYTSGYTTGAIVHQGLVNQEIAFLAKPLTRRTLVRGVRELLDSDHIPAHATPQQGEIPTSLAS